MPFSVTTLIRDEGTLGSLSIWVFSLVVIAGQTPRADLKSKAEQAARTVQKVKNVHNELQVTSPSSLLARNNDAWITTKLKTQMLSDPNVPSSRIKVVK